VNGIEASARTALSGAYPVARPLYMFTNGRPKGAAGEYIKFLLSAEGQRIVKKVGYVPLQ